MNAPVPLELTVAGQCFACRDGDVLGREGTVGTVAAQEILALSRQHLVLRWWDGAWWLTLLPTARNQTLLDGAALVRETPRALRTGKHAVTVQGHVIHLRVGADPGEAAAASQLPAPLERLREELGQGGSLLGLVADHVADLIPTIDQNGRRLGNNAAYPPCLGYPPQEISESDSMAEVHPDDLPLVRRVFEESMRSLVGRRLEYRMRHRDGHWVPLESLARVIAPVGGTNKYLVLVARDISERKRAEAQERERSQRLANRALVLADFARAPAFRDGELAECFTAVTESAARHLDCARAGVWLFSADGAALACEEEFTRETHRHGPGPTLPAGAWPARLHANRCVQAGGTTDGAPTGDLWPGAAADFLAVRIGLVGETAGMLTLEHAEAAGTGWSLEDQGFATSLADTLLVALHARRRAEAFAALQESQRRIAADLAEASNYVRALLPPPLLGGDVESEWRAVPCTTLGGDGLGHRWLDEDHLAIYVIDSVGHGVGAALLAISVLNILRSGALADTDFHDPAQVLTGLNRTFQMETQNNMFFTAWYGVYHRPTRRIVYAVAAHPPAVLFGEDGPPTLLGVDGLMIGVESETDYANAHAEISPGSRLYVFSDGVFEIEDANGNAWGFDSFLALLRKSPPEAGSTELDALREEAQRVNGRPDLPDDFSILRLTFH